MKTIITLLLFLCLCLAKLHGQDYIKLWNKVESLELKGEVKKANALVSKIFKKAKRDKDSKTIIKSFIYKSKFNLILLENGEENFIENILVEIDTNAFPTNAILESIYANFLIDFYNKNSYKFRNRTPIENKDDDIYTWDLSSLKAEIHQHIQNSISNTEGLKLIELKDYIEILEGQTNTLKYRPTLYDFLIGNAIAFYSSHMVSAYGTNDIENEKSHYKSPSAYSNLNIEVVDSISPIYALKLYQDLERFHLKKQNLYPLFDAFTNRLTYLNGRHFTFNHNENLDEAIEKTIERYKDKEASSHLRLYFANRYYEQSTYLNYAKPEIKAAAKNHRRKAHAVCSETIARFPNSEAAVKCENLNKGLENKFLKLETNSIFSSSKPALAKITYSNTDVVYLSAYKIPMEHSFSNNKAYPKASSRRTFNRDSMVFSIIENKKPILHKAYKLIDNGDYYKYSAEVLIPELELGNYLIIVSNTEKITSKKDYAYQTSIRSNLFLTYSDKEKTNEFLVTDRNSGVPLKNARINIYSSNKNYNIIKTTDRSGTAKELKTRKHNGYLKTLVTYKKDSLLLQDVYLSNYVNDRNDEWNAYSKLILDRNIYRPGQDIHFKGYLFQEKKGKRSAVQNMFCSVVISDSQGNELKEFRLKTNAYGTVSGSYTLPKDILTGEFSIELDEDYDYEEDEHPFWDKVDDFEYTEKEFYVENYKRPKFEIQFDKVTENYKLGDSVYIKGKAVSFFNAKISNAKVKYQVYKKHGYKKENLISGEAKTDHSGAFTIPLIINKFNSKNKIKEDYTVAVDVTDSNGETRSSKKYFILGNYNLNPVVRIPYNFDSKNENPIQLVSKNLNDGYLASHGELSIHKVGDPHSRLFNREWQAADYQTIDKDTFSAYFPNMKYMPTQEYKEQLVHKTNFKTKDSLSIYMDTQNWTSGQYAIKGYAIDASKDTIQIDKHFNFKNVTEQDKTVLFGYKILNYDFKKDGKTSIKLTTAFTDVHVNANVYYKNKELYNESIVLNGDHILNIPIKEKINGTISIFLTSNTLGIFTNKSFDLTLTKASNAFNVETQVFRNRLEPDLNETWNFKIKSLDKNVEVLASMYDESLDDFFKGKDEDYGNRYTLDWNSKIEPEDYHRRYYNYNIVNLTKKVQRNNGGNSFFTYRTIPSKYLKLNYFGLDFTNFKYRNNNYLRQIEQKLKSKKEIKALGNTSGVVTDEYGLPMPGVNIIVVGSPYGTQTDFDGFYSIQTKKGETLRFGFIGYRTEDITIQDSNSINLGMEVDVTAIDEVVVTALGIKRKSSSISAHVTYNSVSDFNADVTRKLSGAVSGLQMDHIGSSKIVLRGNSTIKGNEQAIIVVDGILVDASMYASLNPNSVDTVNVMKGAEASALYGSQGANGVVVITTKFGSKTITTDKGKTIVDITEKDLKKVEIRKNLKETAFFLPHLKTNAKNEVEVNFTTPQALTRWKFQLLAHTKKLKYGYLKLNAITQKKLIITPNLPRFLRVGDTMTIAVKITNLSEGDLDGNSYLELYDVNTNKTMATFKNSPFNLAKEGSKNVKWQVAIPEDVSSIRYRILAKTRNFSDGEEGILNVLKKKILVTETLPLYVKGKTKKVFELKKLVEQKSSTLKHDKLTVEYSSNPIWFAFQSLPYLMEFPYDCAEQTFSKYYANALGQHILKSNPKIKEYIETQSLPKKTLNNKVTSEEGSPFGNTSNTNDKLALLFNSERLKEQENNTLIKLKELQLSNGAFSWFGGNGTPNLFITNHIVASYGHLKKLGVKSENQFRLDAIAKKALSYLDVEFSKKMKRENSVDDITVIHYLYARSFFLESNKLNDEHQKIITKHLEKLEKNWITQKLYSKGLIALVFNRLNKTDSAKKVIRALDQSSITNNEFGMYWKENTNSIHWYKSPIETQALLIEAFAEINKNKKDIDNMKLWILSKKQTNSWKTTKATTEAIYALMLQGSDWITIKQNSKIKIGQETISNEDYYLGHYNIVYSKKDEIPNKAKIEIDNNSTSPGFGGMYWQYFEDLDKITAAETPLKLKKKLFLKTNTDKGEEISEITKGSQLKVGDLVRVRIELRSDRVMEFVHMKDMRAAGMEPINVLSQYKYQDGLGYYESTKDASTNFFFDYLPKGVYVFEYDLRVNNAGNMSNGITTIQSMYAPEFSSHSEGIRVNVINIK